MMGSKNVSGLNQDVNHLNENLRVTFSTCNERDHQTVIRSSRTTALLSKNLREPQEIDLHINTNFALEVNKRIKVYLLLNFSFSIVILVICCIFVIELKNELSHVRHNVSTLEQDVSNLISKYKYFDLNRTDVPDKVQFRSQEQSISVHRSVITSESSVTDSVKQNNEKNIYKDVDIGNLGERVIPIVQFRGITPGYQVNNGGSKIGPWVVDNAIMNMHINLNFSLEDNNSTVQIFDSGLYTLYAQLLYETKSERNSYSVMLKPKDELNGMEIARCSADGKKNFQSPVDISCFTSVIHYLKYGDKVYIQQREQERNINMRKGHSFFGLMKINS